MLIINNNKFSGPLTPQKLQSMIAQIKLLPQPNVVSRFSSPIKPEEAVLCLEAEKAYVDLLNPFANIKYIGSKNVVACTLAYISTELDHLVVHVDAFRRALNLEEEIALFNDKSNITISLVGGWQRDDADSVRSLNIIVEALYHAAEKLELTFCIVNQNLSLNCFEDDLKYQTLFNKIVERANILCRQYFNESFEDADFSDIYLRDFKYKPSNLPESHRTGIANLIVVAQEIYDPNDSNFKDVLKVWHLGKESFPTKAALLASIKDMCNVKGAEVLIARFGSIQRLRLPNFVFDIKTKEMHVISPTMKTPHEARRTILCLDRMRDKYFLCYDGRSNKWHVPSYSSTFVERTAHALSLVTNNMGSRAAINAVLGWQLYPPSIDAFVRAARFALKEKNVVTNLGASKRISFLFKSVDTVSSLYQLDDISHMNLSNLSNLTGVVFAAKMRRYPAYTIDAYCQSSSFSDAEQLKYKLETNGVIAHIVAAKISDNPTYYVVVPAINVGEYAKAIAMAPK